MFNGQFTCKGQFPLRIIFLRIKTESKVSSVSTHQNETDVIVTKDTFLFIRICSNINNPEWKPETYILIIIGITDRKSILKITKLQSFITIFFESNFANNASTEAKKGNGN